MNTRNSHLDDSEWQLAQRIANDLHRDGCDRNELRKLLSYLRAVGSTKQMAQMQQARLQHARKLAHRGQTVRYWQSLQKATRLLERLDAKRAAMILGWAERILASTSTRDQ